MNLLHRILAFILNLRVIVTCKQCGKTHRVDRCRKSDCKTPIFDLNPLIVRCLSCNSKMQEDDGRLLCDGKYKGDKCGNLIKMPVFKRPIRRWIWNHQVDFFTMATVLLVILTSLPWTIPGYINWQEEKKAYQQYVEASDLWLAKAHQEINPRGRKAVELAAELITREINYAKIMEKIQLIKESDLSLTKDFLELKRYKALSDPARKLSQLHIRVTKIGNNVLTEYDNTCFLDRS